MVSGAALDIIEAVENPQSSLTQILVNDKMLALDVLARLFQRHINKNRIR